MDSGGGTSFPQKRDCTGVAGGGGSGVGSGVGLGVGPGVGNGVGSGVGPGVGSGVGPGVGNGVGPGVGTGVGARVGSGDEELVMALAHESARESVETGPGGASTLLSAGWLQQPRLLNAAVGKAPSRRPGASQSTCATTPALPPVLARCAIDQPPHHQPQPRKAPPHRRAPRPGSDQFGGAPGVGTGEGAGVGAGVCAGVGAGVGAAGGGRGAGDGGRALELELGIVWNGTATVG
eukprot:gene4073-biopygen4470